MTATLLDILMTSAENSPATCQSIPRAKETLKRRHSICNTMKTVRVCVVALIGMTVVLASAIPAIARPQEASPAANPQQSLVDVGDVWHHIRHVTPQAGTPGGYAPAQTAKRPFFFFSPSIEAKLRRK